MKTTFAAVLGAATLAAGLGLSGGAHAADCDPGKGPDDLTYDEAKTVHDCLKPSLYEGYNQGGKRWIPADYVKDYQSWGAANTAPANPGFHANRYLSTYVNEVGFETYVQYAENPTVPVGTVIAKESFSISDGGEASKGPLFFMEKVAEGVSPETDDWYYMMVSAEGQPQAVNVVSACHECHSGFSDTGNMGYPVEEVRLGQ